MDGQRDEHGDGSVLGQRNGDLEKHGGYGVSAECGRGSDGYVYVL